MSEESSASAGPDSNDSAASRGPESGAPWTARDEWQTPKIPEEHDLSAREDRSSAREQIGCTVAVGVPMLLGSAYFWLQGDTAPALILAGMLLFLVFLTYQAMAVRGRGPIVFAMSELPARLGDRLEGVVHIENWGKEPAPSHFDVYLSRYQRFVRGDGRDKFVDKNLEWRTTDKVEGDLRRANDQMQIPVGFDLPADQPPATIPKEENRTMWVLEVEAPVLDDPLMFELPVLDPEPGTASVKEPGEPTTPTREDEEEAIDVEEAAQPSGDADDTSDHAEPARPSPQIPADGELSVGELSIQIDRSARGASKIQILGSPNVKRGLLSLGLGLPLLALGMLMAIGGFLISPMGLVGLAFALIGGLLTYKSWSPLLCRTTITVDDDNIHVVRRPPGPLLGFSTTTVPRSDVIDVRITAPQQSESASPESISYTVELLYRIDATGTYEPLARHVRRQDVESARQPSLSIPDKEEGSPYLDKLTGRLADQEQAETVAALVRQLVV